MPPEHPAAADDALPPLDAHARLKVRIDQHRGGLTLAATIALASSFLADHPKPQAGIAFSSRAFCC
jgi:hypothetical protein